MSRMDDILSSSNDIIFDGSIDDILDDDIILSSAGKTDQIEAETETVLEPEEETRTFIEPETTQPHLAPEILSSGIYVLDRSIGGGIPGGSVVYISATTKSMSEVFLYQFTQSRKTYYFCTERRPKYVQQDIANMNFDTSQIVFVDVYGSYFMSPQGEMIDIGGNGFMDAKIVEFMEYNLKSILSEETDGEINIIVDTFTFFMNLNLNSGIIRRLINIIYETTKETGGLTFLYSLKDSHDQKLENEIVNTCDAIFDVDIEKTGDKIINKLSIPKIRGMTPTAEMIKFKIGEGIQIDTSRDIA
jgi:KaiC/GvpD/RAD55 family RecA-like ATPase